MPDDTPQRQKNLAFGAVLLVLVIILFCLPFVKFAHFVPTGQ